MSAAGRRGSGEHGLARLFTHRSAFCIPNACTPGSNAGLYQRCVFRHFLLILGTPHSALRIPHSSKLRPRLGPRFLSYSHPLIPLLELFFPVHIRSHPLVIRPFVVLQLLLTRLEDVAGWARNMVHK